ncbi:MAG: Hcp family type VI secretion system effector [Puniceicoccaceae bacterium]
MFLDIEGEIGGESQGAGHEGEIDVLAWSWGLSNSGTFHSGGGGGAGKANFQDISVTKWLDKASPKLMEACATGATLPAATLVLRKAGGEPLEYLVIRMEKVLVTSVSTGGSGGEDRLTENVTLNFAQIMVKYTEQMPDGSQGEIVEFGWDIETNNPLGSDG